MQQKSYAEQIKNSEIILAGVKNHKDELIEKGYTTETFITGYEKRLRDTIELKNTQKKKKAELINTTAQLYEKLDDLNKDRQTFKNIVRMYFAKTQWKSFGIKYHQGKSKSVSDPDHIPDETNIPAPATADEIKKI